MPSNREFVILEEFVKLIIEITEAIGGENG